jgi:hypothetical protein
MVSSLVPVARVRQGRPAAGEIRVTFRDDGGGLPALYLFSDWSAGGGDYRTRDRYDLEEIPVGMDGRGFLLHRDDQAVADDPDGVERYGVFIARNGQDHLCECRGHAAHGHCKHVDALRFLVEGGHLEDPRAGRPPQADAVAELLEAPF